MQAKRVAVILVNWDGWRDTIACVQSLQSLDYPDCRIVIVDNGSTDDSVRFIREAFPGLTVLETGANLGFGGGCNVGIRYALERKAEYIWLLNNDTRVEADSLKAMVETAEQRPEVGAVGSVVYDMDADRVQVFGGGRIGMMTGRPRHYVGAVPDQHLDYLIGASMLIRAQVLEEIGLFDDRRFFMYWEDTDLCFRMRRAGWRLAVAARSIIRHKESGSLGKTNPVLDFYFNRSAARFFRAYSKFPALPVAVGGGGRLMKRLFQGDLRRFSGVWRGLVRGMTEKSGE